MADKPKECPCCGQPGHIDFEYFISECGTQYKLEKSGDSYNLYGPLKGRTTDCYETEIQDKETRIRFLTQEKATLLKIEAALTTKLKDLAEAVIDQAEMPFRCNCNFKHPLAEDGHANDCMVTKAQCALKDDPSCPPQP
jgi:hypothetical protein